MIQFFVDFVSWNPPWGPLISIILFSLIVSVIINLLFYLVTDLKKLREMKEKQKNLQKRLKETQDQKEQLEIQKEMLASSGEMMKNSLKTMLVSFVPAVLMLAFLKMLYMDWAKIGNIISWEKDLWLVHDGAGWFLCYIIFSFIFSMIIQKKIMKI